MKTIGTGKDAQAVSTATLGGMGEAAQVTGTYIASCLRLEPEYQAIYDTVYAQKMAALEKNPSANVAHFDEQLDSLPRYEVWNDTIKNVITNVGKQWMLDGALKQTNTLVGPYMGLISSVGFTTPVSADTMASHAGWNEVSAVTNFPTVAARSSAVAFNAATSATSTSTSNATSAVSFTIIINAGTLSGAFIVIGTGAVTTLGSTAGILFSAGAFTGGNKVVAVSDVVNVSYSAAVTS